MAIKGYSDVAAVELHLNRTLTAAQEARAYSLLEAAEAFIDSESGAAWLVTSPVANEQHILDGPLLYLANKPITAVSSLSVRSPYVGSEWTALTAGSGYEVLDATRGLLHLSSGYAGWLVRVTYTLASPVHPLIREAATQLVAFWLRPALDGVTSDVESYSVGQELTVKFRSGKQTLGVPDEVVALVRKAVGGRLVFA